MFFIFKSIYLLFSYLFSSTLNLDLSYVVFNNFRKNYYKISFCYINRCIASYSKYLTLSNLIRKRTVQTTAITIY